MVIYVFPHNFFASDHGVIDGKNTIVEISRL